MSDKETDPFDLNLSRDYYLLKKIGGELAQIGQELWSRGHAIENYKAISSPTRKITGYADYERRIMVIEANSLLDDFSFKIGMYNEDEKGEK